MFSTGVIRMYVMQLYDNRIESVNWYPSIDQLIVIVYKVSINQNTSGRLYIPVNIKK